MKILIENAESLEYLANDGKWTKNASAGSNFGSTQAAFEAATSEPIGRFNIVCYIPQKPKFIIFTMEHGEGTGASTGPVQPSPLAISQPGRNGSSQGRRHVE
jgi:hypothetical protein